MEYETEKGRESREKNLEHKKRLDKKFPVKFNTDWPKMPTSKGKEEEEI